MICHCHLYQSQIYLTSCSFSLFVFSHAIFDIEETTNRIHLDVLQREKKKMRKKRKKKERNDKIMSTEKKVTCLSFESFLSCFDCSLRSYEKKS